MGKGTHFIGQPMFGQLISLIDKLKVLGFSREKGGERYVKHFDAWQHLVVMLYAVIKPRSLKLAGMRNTLSIKRTVLSGRVSANCSARFTMRRASRVVASQAHSITARRQTNMH